MNREELLDKIEGIQYTNYTQFQGSNEADLHIREEIADLIEQEKKAEVIAFLEWMATMPNGIGYTCTNEDVYNDFKEVTK
jgi:hypothetical protein